MSTFLGMPRGRVPGPPADTAVGQLTGDRPFPAAARDALANTRLRRNLAHATATIRAKRAAVVGEVPDWEALRDAGSAIKADTMARLPELLEQLERNVTARGGTVHWARDAAEANRIVLDLVRATGADEVVKVKSMATQEIGLNEALEAAGITAHETDLAELIVQLGHDKPSHILVPAIHRGRAEIRDIFAREMADVDLDSLTDEPSVLAAAARTHLREVFLRARVAVSGANFGVAETGTLTVVESEGNGRMCLTLPDTLITVMGIEKVVPTWRDLEVFLQLLPRSSTGERMNPYTSTWTGVTPGDGPQDVHLVLLDNGRTRALADDLGRTALHCIRCSACLNVCPVYERTGGHAYGSVYPGPIGAVLTPVPHRRHRRRRPQRLAALRLQPVRRVLRRVPRQDQHPRPARRAARRAHRGPRRHPPAALAGGRRDGGRRVGDGRRDALRAGRARSDDRATRHTAWATPPAAAAAPERVDRLPRRPEPARRDVPRLVGPHPRGALVSARDEVLARIRGALGDAPGGRASRSPAPTARTGEHAARVGAASSSSSSTGSRTTAPPSSARAADDESVGAAIASRSRGRRRHAPRSPPRASPTRGRPAAPGCRRDDGSRRPRATSTSSTRS